MNNTAIVCAQPVVDPDAEAVDAKQRLLAISGAAITSQGEYAMLGEVLTEANHKWKWLEEERKITVSPANKEVERINDWFRPALTALRSLRSQAEGLMGAWILHQRKEEQRLLNEAAAAAVVTMATANKSVPGASAVHAEAARATGLLVSAAAAAVPVKVQGVAHKAAWRWSVVDAASVPRAFLMPDEKKIAAHVSKYGTANAISGVEVIEDVSFTVRS